VERKQQQDEDKERWTWAPAREAKANMTLDWTLTGHWSPVTGTGENTQDVARRFQTSVENAAASV
jgi:hypothetical protein